MLTCNVAGGVGLIIGSSKAVDCIFQRTVGQGERYGGWIGKLGLESASPVRRVMPGRLRARQAQAARSPATMPALPLKPPSPLVSAPSAGRRLQQVDCAAAGQRPGPDRPQHRCGHRQPQPRGEVIRGSIGSMKARPCAGPFSFWNSLAGLRNGVSLSDVEPPRRGDHGEEGRSFDAISSVKGVGHGTSQRQKAIGLAVRGTRGPLSQRQDHASRSDPVPDRRHPAPGQGVRKVDHGRCCTRSARSWHERRAQCRRHQLSG